MKKETKEKGVLFYETLCSSEQINNDVISDLTYASVSVLYIRRYSEKKWRIYLKMTSSVLGALVWHDIFL